MGIPETPQEVAAYIQDHYGSCELAGRCICLDQKHPKHRGWLGTICRHWHPVPWRSWEEMRAGLIPPVPS